MKWRFWFLGFITFVRPGLLLHTFSYCLCICFAFVFYIAFCLIWFAIPQKFQKSLYWFTTWSSYKEMVKGKALFSLIRLAGGKQIYYFEEEKKCIKVSFKEQSIYFLQQVHTFKLMTRIERITEKPLRLGNRWSKATLRNFFLQIWNRNKLVHTQNTFIWKTRICYQESTTHLAFSSKSWFQDNRITDFGWRWFMY